MLLNLKRINFEYLTIALIAVLAGLLISFYNLSILFLLISILFVLISFKYFNQVLVILIFYLPFQVALNITSGIDLASGRVLILCLFLVWAIKSLAEKRFIIKFNLQTLLIGLFLFLALLSILQAWDTERAVRKVLVFLSIFPLYFIITSLSIKSSKNVMLSLSKHFIKEKSILNNETFQQAQNDNVYEHMIENKNNYISKILQALVLSGFILSLIGIIQFILQFFIGIDPIIIFWSEYIAPLFYGQTFGAEVVANPSWLVNISGITVFRAISLFPDPHMFSFYIGLLVPIVLAIVLVNDNKTNFFNSNLLYFVLASMLLAELLTFSRGGYIGMIAGIGVLIILSWRYISVYKKAAIGLLFAVFLFAIFFTHQSIVSRFLSSFDFSEGSNIERIRNWQQGWGAFSDNLLTGVGIGNYSIYLYPTIEYRAPVYAHNLYLDIGVEMGIFALLVWILLIAITIWQLYKLSAKTKDNFSRALSLGLVGSLFWFSAHGIFDTPIYSPTILGIFVIVISFSALVLSKKH